MLWQGDKSLSEDKIKISKKELDAMYEVVEDEEIIATISEKVANKEKKSKFEEYTVQYDEGDEFLENA